MKKLSLILGSGLVCVLLLAGCKSTTTNNTNDTPTQSPTNTQTEVKGKTGLANPASVNCGDKGGKLVIKDNKLGQYGVCVFDDNRQCEEWALFRGDCPVGGLKVTGYENDAEVYCAITGGTVEGVGTKTPMCKRIDGTYCNAEANFNGECPNPLDSNPTSGNVEVK